MAVAGNHNLALGIGIVPDDFPHRRHLNGAGQRIFNADHWGGDGGFYLGFFKTEIGIFHLAVNEGQVFAVAEGLGAFNLTVDQGQAIGVPS